MQFHNVTHIIEALLSPYDVESETLKAIDVVLGEYAESTAIEWRNGTVDKKFLSDFLDDLAKIEDEKREESFLKIRQRFGLN